MPNDIYAYHSLNSRAFACGSFSTCITAPYLTAAGREALDALLAKNAQDRRLPAIFYGACTADDVLYERQSGLVDYDDPSKGEVNERTSESSSEPEASLMSRRSSTSVLRDKVCHLCESSYRPTSYVLIKTSGRLLSTGRTRCLIDG
jgi:hypothetical protein